MKMLASVVLTSMLLFSLTVPVLANSTPTQERFSVSVDFPVVDCGDFQIHDALTADVHDTIFFDRAGVAVREIFQGIGIDHLYNFSDPSQFVEGHFSETRKVNLLTGVGETTINGPSWQITVPGYGIVFFLTGHNIYSETTGPILERGLHHLDEELLCSLLR